MIAGFAASSIYLLSLALLFAAGFLNLAFGAMSQALVQMHAPQHIRGRVLGLYSTSVNGMRTFSGITVSVFWAVLSRPNLPARAGRYAAGAAPPARHSRPAQEGLGAGEDAAGSAGRRATSRVSAVFSSARRDGYGERLP